MSALHRDPPDQLLVQVKRLVPGMPPLDRTVEKLDRGGFQRLRDDFEAKLYLVNH